MGAPKKFKTAKSLEKAVDAYFDSITREVPLTEKVETGKRDKHGHMIYKDEPVYNKNGAQAVITQYLIPPTVDGLCNALHIHRSTWADYCNHELHPEFSDTTTRARGRMRAWREEQLLTRKDVKGLIFDLENNYYKREEHSSGGRKADNIPMEEREELLKELAQEMRGDIEELGTAENNGIP